MMQLNSLTRKATALTLVFLMLNQAILPTAALALTGGPSQPEVQGFQPIGTTDMVDLFSGDFSYNIPLLDVDGYPLNISYQSNPGIDDEASWVGLGWTLNPGVMTRDVRGYPDDFDGDKVRNEFNMKDNTTVGVTRGLGVEFGGFFGLNASLGTYYNTYRGWGQSFGLTPSISVGKSNSTLTASLGINYDSQNGVDLNASVGFGWKNAAGTKSASATLGTSMNSRTGLKDLSFSASARRKEEKTYTKNNVQVTDKFYGGFGSSGTVYSFGKMSYFPTSSLPFTNDSWSANITGGSEAFAAHPNARISAYGNKQKLATKSQVQSAYGYLNHYNAKDKDYALMDYNKDQQLTYREDMKNLPLAYGTYDLFSASGQGVSGQFRAVRNDVGILRGGSNENPSTSGSWGAEIGVGAFFHAGVDVQAGLTTSKSGKWKEDNEAKDVLDFTTVKTDFATVLSPSERFYEPVYFKNTGENVVLGSTFYNNLGENNPSYVNLNKTASTVTAKKSLVAEPGGNKYQSQVARNLERQRRSQVFSYLTAEQATSVGLDKKIKSYSAITANTKPTCAAVTITESERVDAAVGRAKHHISEVTVTQGDGGRYIYGIPAYNKKQREVSFNIQPSAAEITGATGANSNTLGLIPYVAGSDNSTNNSKGRDHFFEATEVSPYAHSYLLTAVLSSDYVDRTNDGITDDDLGNAIKLNYTKTYDNYRWRSPYQLNMARYDQGYKSEPKDDKASYVYGEKEIWYVHSIESRTMVAQFYTSNREDGYSVSGENGGIGTQSSQKLDKIELYSKSDLKKNGANALPIKTVNFDYEYRHCGGIPNKVAPPPDKDKGNGKLTLIKIWFTYGNSTKGALNAYKFSYKNTIPATSDGGNFDYNIGYNDRWGNYKKSPANTPSNLDYPYSIQTPQTANDYAGAWSLNKIDLPSGGSINVEYESDDYAFVQDKRAGQMFKIKGFVENGANYVSTGAGLKTNLYENKGDNINSFVVIDLTTPVANLAELKNRYLGDVGQLYFKFNVQLDNNPAHKDHVFGYADFNSNNVLLRGTAPNQEMLIPLNSVPRDKGSGVIHPATKAAFQLMRLNLPEIAYYNPLNTSNGIAALSIVNSILATAASDDLKAIFKGFDRTKMDKNWSRVVDVANSWVRLANPTFKKFGGGSRVKTLKISDGWDIMTGGATSEYGQTYSYDMEIDDPNGDDTKIVVSSGVASYEPQIGGDEISLKVPLPYKENVKLAPDNSFYTERPIGESLFPAPSVGYSQVKVRTLNNNIARTGTGYSINKFYTARDFPIISKFSNLAAGTKKVRSNPVLKFFKIGVKEHVSASQGYIVEVNDMHGKPKEESVYNEFNSLISSSIYSYKTDSGQDNAPSKHLNNDISVVKPDGTIAIAKMGVDMDVWHEMQQDVTKTKVGGVNVNTDGFLAFFFPGIVIAPYPVIMTDSRQLRTSVTTKFIKRFGILDKVTVTENGSTVSTKNVLHDSETGEVLLTETQNEFDDPVFQFKYPAHWAFDRMGQAYRNLGLKFTSPPTIAGAIKVTNGLFTAGFDPTQYFVPGDEVIATELLNESPLTVQLVKLYIVRDPSASTLRLVQANGNFFRPNATANLIKIEISRSGRRNMATSPIASVSSRFSPVVNNEISFTNTSPLQASANTYSEDWNMDCIVIEGIPTVNPFTSGGKGNWRPNESWVFYTNRTPGTIAATNIRSDGVLDAFYPYWEKPANGSPSGSWSKTSNAAKKWTLQNEVSRYDEKGNEIENFDAIGIPSSAYFGYNQTRSVAVASNSEIGEMTYDNFEDYDFNNLCTNSSNLNIKKNLRLYISPTANRGLTLEQAHTGRYSLWLSANLTTFDTLLTTLSPLSCGGGSTAPLSKPNSAVPEEDAGSGGSAQTAAVPSNCTSYQLAPSNTAYTYNCCGCFPKFFPAPTDSVVVSFWMASDTSVAIGKNLVNAGLKLRYFGASQSILQTTTIVPAGPVIDGWQRAFVKVKVPSAAVSGSIIAFNPGNSNGRIFLDDFRIHPWDANMKSFAYDPWTLRLMAQLDENNYATFFEYDDEGLLVRIKRETDKGIATIKEARTILKPNN